MGLKDDLIEAKELWTNSSWVMKCIIGISMFLTISSVTSLSDVFFGWKGFILDGVEFYRTYLIGPVVYLISVFGVKLQPLDIDAFIVIILFVVSYWRAIGLSGVVDSFKKTPVVDTIVYAGWLFGIIDLCISQNDSDAIFIFCTLGLVFMIMTIVFYRANNLLALRYLSPLAVAIVVVLILGAVNAGLSRN
jgi:hypothetical protein